jgi:SAM-dependent methyltransferase
MHLEEKDVPGLKGYLGQNVKELCRKYESARFEDIHAAWLPHLPADATTAVDIGAGSGRDAFALYLRGLEVAAVEPSADMMFEARQHHAHTNIDWVQDYLPHLNSLIKQHRTFNLVLINAVWMHLDSPERSEAMRTVARLLKPSAIAVITLRHPKDPNRHMFDVTPDETISLAVMNRLQVLIHKTIDDPVPEWERHLVSWSLLVLSKNSHSST